MTQVTTLKFRKKITAVFADGSSKMNLNVASAVALTADLSGVDVELDGSTEAGALFQDFTKERLGRAIPNPESGRLDFAQPSSATEEVERVTARPAVLGVGFGTQVGPANLQGTADLAPRVPPDRMITDPEALGRPATTRNPGYIVLGPSAVYTDANIALRDLLAGTDSSAILSDHYHNKLTATFKAGSPDGHLKSLFRDFRKFGLRIAPKLVEYRDFVLTTDWPETSVYAKFKADFLDGKLPTDPATFEGHAVSSRYFKFWALATGATMKPADLKRER